MLGCQEEAAAVAVSPAGPPLAMLLSAWSLSEVMHQQLLGPWRRMCMLQVHWQLQVQQEQE